MFKITDIQLELITDIDMFQFIEKGMPSGISYIFLTDLEKQTINTWNTYVFMYLDVNNLYGWAVSQYLPTGGFKWLNISMRQVKKTSSNIVWKTKICTSLQEPSTVS